MNESHCCESKPALRLVAMQARKAALCHHSYFECLVPSLILADGEKKDRMGLEVEWNG